ncbi:hypothetical protein [Nostoc sp. TCL240-02]|uniref:hypothetical protein n=1 Tax=Nostoc sp. TCL240-02 TaxID=2572090 RepID=UPI00157F83EB|nr:hypothetical protein [Nostoc sp. TCL240-02]QKQ75671.1 hypothetical protein FBB35_22350 [Nostoc sp. TCL240-02]
MAKPIGYWTTFQPGDQSLLSQMEGAWGSHFEGLNEAERVWMVYQLASQLLLDAEGSVSDTVQQVIQHTKTGVDNLNKLGLMQALIEQVKGG